MTARPTATLTAALSLVLGAALLATSVPARAEDDDVPIDTKIFRGIMSGLGLKRDGESGIEYGDRAPARKSPAKRRRAPDLVRLSKSRSGVLSCVTDLYHLNLDKCAFRPGLLPRIRALFGRAPRRETHTAGL